ncbi:hypothetical protein QYE76_019287 [Lolium multiflorum]|uniref:Reverse transcriptase domain-containing protein n=1 Tax=Lolium multiflorum TaxID=4521 RepID=A0AAD8R2N5_LOLMU|nr:hypothetical protein QYE76_019287 [Lolium multiflorum]
MPPASDVRAESLRASLSEEDGVPARSHRSTPGSVLPAAARRWVSDITHYSRPVGPSLRHQRIAIYIEMADGTRSRTRIDRGAQKKYDESKRSSKPTSSALSTEPAHTAWKGFSPEGALDGVDLSAPSEERTRSLRQEVNFMVAHSLHRHSESLVNTLERVALRVIQEIMSHQYSPSGPALGTYQGEMPLQSRPPLPLAAPEVPNSPAYAVDMVECTYPRVPAKILVQHQRGRTWATTVGAENEGEAALLARTRGKPFHEIGRSNFQKVQFTIKMKADSGNRPVLSLPHVFPVFSVDLTDCFAWDYTEMPGLDRSIIEHRLPLKKGFRPFQQRARQMKAEILEEVKKEIEKMLAAGFIRPCRYAEWISSIVPVEKKDGRWRVAIDFRDLNRATPKDEYPMPVAETLINAAAGHKVLSFMDGNAGYNQIFMAPEDIHKTAFRVPGSVGLFEYVVRPLG